MNQQIIISGLGGQGILFITRLLADAAIGRGLPVLTSETHGMAQRGGVVISHLKAGEFASPLVRRGEADALLILRSENLPLHLPFLKKGGMLVLNGREAPPGLDSYDIHVVDADRIALEGETPQSVNLILLGFALARGRGLFCSVEEAASVITAKLEKKEKMLQSALRALEAGADAARREYPEKG
jgi:indolepyruvate ferredoxin oxidoreductase, beta subunit